MRLLCWPTSEESNHLTQQRIELQVKGNLWRNDVRAYLFTKLLLVSFVLMIPNAFSRGLSSGEYWGRVTAYIPQQLKKLWTSSVMWIAALSKTMMSFFLTEFHWAPHRFFSSLSKSIKKSKISLELFVPFLSTVCSAPSSVRADIAATPKPP